VQTLSFHLEGSVFIRVTLSRQCHGQQTSPWLLLLTIFPDRSQPPSTSPSQTPSTRLHGCTLPSASSPWYFSAVALSTTSEHIVARSFRPTSPSTLRCSREKCGLLKSTGMTTQRSQRQPTPDVYGFGDNAANDRGPRYGEITRNETDLDLVRPPVSVANPARLSKGKSDVLRSVADCPAPAAEAEPSPSRSSWTTCRPASSVYSADHEEPPPIPPMPAIDEASGSHFSKMDDEINRIVNSRILAPANYDERRRALFESSERQRLAKQHTAERPAKPRRESHEEHRDRSRTQKQRKHRSKAEYSRSTLVQGGWERKKKNSDRRRRSQSGPPSVGHRPAERDRLEPEARRSGREPEHHRGHRQGKPPKKVEKPSGWFDKMTERLVTGAAK
jgi:hypothetical protein